MSQLGGKYTRPQREVKLGSSVRSPSESGFWGWNPELGKPMQSPGSWSFPPGAKCFAERVMSFAIQPSTGFLFFPSDHLLQWVSTLTETAVFPERTPFLPPLHPPNLVID